MSLTTFTVHLARTTITTRCRQGTGTTGEGAA